MKTLAVRTCTGLMLSGLLIAGPLQAASLTVPDSDAGWYDDTGGHFPTGENIIVGYIADFVSYDYSTGGPREFHDFFVFDLSAITGTVLSGQLELYNPTNGYSSPDSNETYELYAVTTSIALLTAGGFGHTDIYNDLGSGTSYGLKAAVSSSDNDSTITINLNASAITDLNLALGESFAIGGAITTLTSGASDEVLFGYTGSSSTKQLVLEVTPEPSMFLFLTSGILALTCWRKRS